jgi:hypothetical protein
LKDISHNFKDLILIRAKMVAISYLRRYRTALQAELSGRYTSVADAAFGALQHKK